MSQPASDGATQGVVGQVGDEHVPGHVGDQQRRAGIADHDLGGDPTRPERLADAAARRPADAVAVLDELEVEREHFIGTSWAAGLGFAIGQHASDRPSVASVPVASYDSGGALPPWLSVAFNGTRAPRNPSAASATCRCRCSSGTARAPTSSTSASMIASAAAAVSPATAGSLRSHER